MTDQTSTNGRSPKPSHPNQYRGGYRPRGQYGYQPHAEAPINPKALKPPQGGSAVQPPPQSRTTGRNGSKP